MNFNDRHLALKKIEPTARVSSLAAIGFPGEWRGRGSKFPAVIGHEAIVSEYARVQAGCERDTIVGEGAFIMAGAHIGHDAIVGANSDICPNAVICGLAEIGAGVKVYSGAVVSPNVKVGDGAIIAANSTVTKDVPDNQVWGGSPAKFIRMREGF